MIRGLGRTGVLMAVVVGGIVAVGSWMQRAQSEGEGLPASIPIPTEGNPLALGSQSNISQARSLLPFPVHLPSDPVANETTLTGVWLDASQAQLGLVFNGEVTIMMWPNHYPDVMAYFEDWIARNTAKAEIVQVGSAPGLVIHAGTDEDASNPAWVEVVANGIDINLYSYKHSTDELLRLVGTMIPPGSLP